METFWGILAFVIFIVGSLATVYIISKVWHMGGK